MLRKVFRLAVVVLSATSFLSACSPSLSSNGPAASMPTAGSCFVVVRQNVSLPPEAIREIDVIDVGDTGLSTDCSEKTVVGILRERACAVGANMVDVIEERAPDASSTCFRARARLLDVHSAVEATELMDDPRFAKEQVESRSAEQAAHQETVLWISVILGAILGVAIGAGVAAATSH